MGIVIEGNYLRIIRGDLAQLELELYDETNGTEQPYPLTEGDEIVVDVKTTKDATQSVVRSSIKEFVDGVAHVEFTPEQTSSLDPGIYIFQIKLILPDLRGVHTLFEGNLNVKQWTL